MSWCFTELSVTYLHDSVNAEMPSQMSASTLSDSPRQPHMPSGHSQSYPCTQLLHDKSGLSTQASHAHQSAAPSDPHNPVPEPRAQALQCHALHSEQALVHAFSTSASWQQPSLKWDLRAGLLPSAHEVGYTQTAGVPEAASQAGANLPLDVRFGLQTHQSHPYATSRVNAQYSPFDLTSRAPAQHSPFDTASMTVTQQTHPHATSRAAAQHSPFDLAPRAPAQHSPVDETHRPVALRSPFQCMSVSPVGRSVKSHTLNSPLPSAPNLGHDEEHQKGLSRAGQHRSALEDTFKSKLNEGSLMGPASTGQQHNASELFPYAGYSQSASEAFSNAGHNQGALKGSPKAPPPPVPHPDAPHNLLQVFKEGAVTSGLYPAAAGASGRSLPFKGACASDTVQSDIATGIICSQLPFRKLNVVLMDA